MSSDLIVLADRYALEERIARGGMAAVWRGTDRVLARTVALKVLDQGLGEDDAFVERFRFEATAAAGLLHPRIVSVYDTGSDVVDGVTRYFIVMEHCGGGTLADKLRAVGPLDAQEVSRVGGQICDALGYAHRHGIVHRDVKPANVLFSEEDELKVADFGIAKAAERAGDITTTGMILGTVAYISPEQARGEEPDRRSDLYALGVVLYELLVGRPPFADESQLAVALKHVNERPPDPRSVRAGVPRGLAAVIMKALEKDPDDRFDDAEEMKAALSGHAGSPTVAVPVAPRDAPGRRDRSVPRRSPSPLRGLGPVILLIGAAIAAAIFLPRALDDGPGSGGPGGEPSGRSLRVISVDDFDPDGDGAEHEEEAAFAADGDPTTTWSSETYNGSLEAVDKSGVGLLFDLGSPTDVTGIDLRSETPGFDFEIRSSDEPGDDEDAFETIASGSASTRSTVEVDGSARYWLVWITRLPGDSGRVTISEVGFLGG